MEAEAGVLSILRSRWQHQRLRRHDKEGQWPGTVYPGALGAFLLGVPTRTQKKLGGAKNFGLGVLGCCGFWANVCVEDSQPTYR